MDEVCKYQESITNSLVQENKKYTESDEVHNLDHMISKAKTCHEKLVNTMQGMLIIKDKISKLKRGAIKLKEEKTRRDIEAQRSRERREMFEKHLEPVVNTKRDG